MKIQSAVIEGANILRDKSILSAQIDTEILMAKALGKNREYIILNHDKVLNNKDALNHIKASQGSMQVNFEELFGK